MKLVKRGEFFNNPFNIKKRARNEEYDHLSVIEDPQAPIDITMQGDEASKWLSQQGVKPVPSDTKVEKPYVDERSFNVDEWMDLWIKSNAEGIKRENTDEIAADVSLYREIKKHPEYQNILSEKINKNFPLVGKEKSDMFVQTMLAKTQGLMGEIDEKERQMAEDKPFNKEEGISAVEQDIAKKAYNRFMTLSPEERDLVDDIIKMKYTPQMLSQSIEYRFEDPGSLDKLDQRFNFFLYNPQFLEPFLQDDIYFKTKFDNAKTKYQKISVMKQEKGDDLINVLSGLIDSLDPSIINWVKKRLNYINRDVSSKDISESVLLPETDEGRPMTMEGDAPRDWADLAITGADKAESLKFMSNAVKYYLEDNISEMLEINNESSVSIMQEAHDGLKELIKESYINNKEIPPSKKKKKLNQYATGERLNAYFKGYHEQLVSLFDAEGGLNKNDSNKVRYKNKDGFMDIPSNIMKEMLDIAKKYREDEGQDEDEFGRPKIVDIADYHAYVDYYRKAIKDRKVKDPFRPEWKKMIKARAVMRNMAELGEIKNKIFDLKDKKFEDLSAIRKVLSGERDVFLLNHFANVSESDTDSIAGQKIDDFIFMTLNQDKDDYYMDVPLNAYKNQTKINKRQKEIDILSNKLRTKYNKKDEDTRDDMQNKLNEDSLKDVNNYKIALGTLYISLLPKLAKIQDQKIINKETNMEEDRFLPSSLFGFVELFDSHPTRLRNFLNRGQQVNRDDLLGRTNTELYYKIRGEEPPSHVRALQNIYNRGVETGEINKDKWYKELFSEYGKFDAYQRAYDKKKEREEFLTGKLNERVEKANNKVLDVVRSNDNGIAFQKVLNIIGDPNKRIEVENNINQWDGISELPLDYYGLFGQKLTATGIEKDKAAIKKIQGGYKKRINEEGKEVSVNEKGEEVRVRSGEEGLDDIYKMFEKQKTDLRNKLKERNVDIDFSALRIAESMYRIVQNKILKLSKIKEYSYKFASVNVLEIDKSIEVLKDNYDKFFMSLFS